MLKQISIFTENKKGAMLQVTETISNAEINVISVVTNDSAEYGIVRLIVSDSEKCFKILTEAGYLCKLTSIIAVEVSEEIGSLTNLLNVLTEMNINIDYIYSTYYEGKLAMVLRSSEIENVENSLRSKGFITI